MSYIPSQSVILIYAGTGPDASANVPYFNDFWAYSITLNQWAWIAGDGTKTFAASTVPIYPAGVSCMTFTPGITGKGISIYGGLNNNGKYLSALYQVKVALVVPAAPQSLTIALPGIASSSSTTSMTTTSTTLGFVTTSISSTIVTLTSSTSTLSVSTSATTSTVPGIALLTTTTATPKTSASVTSTVDSKTSSVFVTLNAPTPTHFATDNASQGIALFLNGYYVFVAAGFIAVLALMIFLVTLYCRRQRRYELNDNKSSFSSVSNLGPRKIGQEETTMSMSSSSNYPDSYSQYSSLTSNSMRTAYPTCDCFAFPRVLFQSSLRYNEYSCPGPGHLQISMPAMVPVDRKCHIPWKNQTVHRPSLSANLEPTHRLHMCIPTQSPKQISYPHSSIACQSL